jgi:hypothetical protein
MCVRGEGGARLKEIYHTFAFPLVGSCIMRSANVKIFGDVDDRGPVTRPMNALTRIHQRR